MPCPCLCSGGQKWELYLNLLYLDFLILSHNFISLYLANIFSFFFLLVTSGSMTFSKSCQWSSKSMEGLSVGNSRESLSEGCLSRSPTPPTTSFSWGQSNQKKFWALLNVRKGLKTNEKRTDYGGNLPIVPVWRGRSPPITWNTPGGKSKKKKRKSEFNLSLIFAGWLRNQIHLYL